MDIIRDNAHSLYDLLCEAYEAFDGEEESVKEEHGGLIAKMDELLGKLRPPREFLFDVRLNASIRVHARTESEAAAMLERIDANTANLGAWPNGDPILCEVSIFENAGGGVLSAVEIDGEPT
ncbi:hypothetical protein [Shinella zoogloeoides]|uniref:hypothetical protein n=1 Tax=Shinella zoogloeoides TaxID=352475 RepID=UPI00299DE6B3|nr:hypothetical protein [Shinella zoogloeoides]WPE19909.1 hypothetical protein ShzoTeo12_10850 [Shinella zoogloeoides]